MAFEVMEDCIHLKACRRVQAIGRKHRLMVPRYCTEDCTAYFSGDTGSYVPVEDVYEPQDLEGKTIGELIDEAGGDA